MKPLFKLTTVTSPMATCGGRVVSRTGGNDKNIKARIRKAQQAFAVFRPVWKSTAISTKSTLPTVQLQRKSGAVVRLRNMESDQVQLQTHPGLHEQVNKCLKQILHFTSRFSKVPNETLLARTHQQPLIIEVQTRRRKWRWIEHILRKVAFNITRQALEWNQTRETKTISSKRNVEVEPYERADDFKPYLSGRQPKEPLKTAEKGG
jgi:hypothetical protein